VGKEHVGTSAIDEWEAEKQQSEGPAANRARPRQKKLSRGLSSHARGEVGLGTGRSSSPAIEREEQDTPRVARQRNSKKLVILSSSSPIQIPETQQEKLPRPGNIAVEVSRPIDFHSQDYAIATDSQVERNLGTLDTAASKGNSEEDSTLGSSIPPDSPIQSAAGNSTIQESSSQVLLSTRSAGSPSQSKSAASGSVSRTSASSGVEFSSGGQELQSIPEDLLVIRSDPIGAADGVGSQLAEQASEHTAEHPAEQISSSSAPSPLFFADEEDIDLQPISGPNRQEEESDTEGELEVLPVLSSSPSSGSRGLHARESSAVSSVRIELSEGGSQPNPPIASTPPVQSEATEAPNLFGNTTPAIRAGSAQPVDTISTSIQSSPPLSSERFYSQLSLPEAPATHTERPLATSSLKTSNNLKLSVTIPRPFELLAAQLSESIIESTSSPGEIPRSIPFLRHPATSPHDSVVSSESNFSPIQAEMSNSDRESSPRIRRPPAPTEMTPELSLREKLRQLRASSRANEITRSRSQVNPETPGSPTTAILETRSVRQLSPVQSTQPVASTSTAAEDQPIPSLENVDGSTAEMEVDRAGVEPASISSLAPPPTVVHAASHKSTMPMEDHDVEKTMSELDISTMPLLHPSEFVVPLPVDGRIKHQYLAVLKERDEDVNDFLNSPKSPRLISSMGSMIRQLNDTVVHTDLGLEGPATQIASTAEEALWAEDASSKFAFLGRLISTLRGSNHHIVVLVRSGSTQDILRSYLEGKRVTYQQGSGANSAVNSQEGGREDDMKYTLLATDQASLKNIPNSASLILAFDDSFEASMLPEWCSSARFVPVILLLVVNSAEHVGRCIPQDILEPERLRRLVKAVWHVQNELGEMSLQFDFGQAFSLALVKKDLGVKIAHAAGQVAEALQSENFALHFTLPPISELDLSGLEDDPPSTEESKEVSSPASRAGTPAGQKRLRVSRRKRNERIF
jgi:Class II histone deacetylase complex subunits 2 and 3